MAKIKKLHITSFSILQMVLFGLLGLVCGITYAFGGLIIDTLVSWGLLEAASAGTPGLGMGTVLAFGAILGMPLIGAVFGLITGIIGAALYNVFAKKFGGLKVKFKTENESNRTYQ